MDRVGSLKIVRVLGIAMLPLLVFATACGASNDVDVAGVYVLDSEAVRDRALDLVDEIEDPNEKLAMGMVLTMMQSLTVVLHLEPDGTAFVSGVEPRRTGTWSATGNTVVAFMSSGDDEPDRYEATLDDPLLVVAPGGGFELPFELVFERRLDE